MVCMYLPGRASLLAALAVFFHGTFGAFLFIGKTGLPAAGALVSFYFCLRLSWRALRRQQERSGRFVRGASQAASKPAHP